MGNSTSVCVAKADESVKGATIVAPERYDRADSPRSGISNDSSYGVSPRHGDHFESSTGPRVAHTPRAVMSFKNGDNAQHLNSKANVMETASPTHNKKATACHNGLSATGGKCLTKCDQNPSGKEVAPDQSIKYLENHKSDHLGYVAPDACIQRNPVPYRESTKQYEFNYYDFEIQIPEVEEVEEEEIPLVEEEMWEGEDGVMYTASQWAAFENEGWEETVHKP